MKKPKKVIGPLIKIQDFDRADGRREKKQFWIEMAAVVNAAVVNSFMNDDGMRNPSKGEMRHRVDVATDLAKIMRNDLHWSRQRIRDNISLALDAKLAGIEFDLEALGRRATWSPG